MKKKQCKGLNRTGANVGKQCKHMAKKGEDYCGHHLRTLRKYEAEASGKSAEGKIVEFPMVDDGRGDRRDLPNPFDVAEQTQYALDVAHGRRFYMQTRMRGGTGKSMEVKVFPDWGDRARWLEIAYKFAQNIQAKDERTEEVIQAEIRSALGLDG